MWYPIYNAKEIDSPALVLYKERITGNIERVKEIADGQTEKLRPHIKTNKIKEVCTLLMEAGIRKFKCATIAEAEMLAMAGASDVLLAYQPVGPKVSRLLRLVSAYPATSFSCLVDNEVSVRALNEESRSIPSTLDVFIDINVGMNRTGILPEKAVALADYIRKFSHLRLTGLHGYDGHIHQTDLSFRKDEADRAFEKVNEVYKEIQFWFDHPLVMVMGGTPTFPIHIHRQHCECSPGTFTLWDWGYAEMLPDLAFDYAALVLTRVISIVDETRICVDLGHKSVAAESPLPRVHFLNAPEAVPESQSEEHLVLTVPDSSEFEIGHLLYGVPVHICPTVALYDKAHVIENGLFTTTWDVIARNRKITI